MRYSGPMSDETLTSAAAVRTSPVYDGFILGRGREGSQHPADDRGFTQGLPRVSSRYHGARCRVCEILQRTA